MRYTDPLNEQTFYAIFVEWRGEIRPFTVEHPMLETEDEVIAALKEHPNAIAVYRVDPDMPRRDVSEDIARRWWSQIQPEFIEDDDDLPKFLGRYLTDDEMFGHGRIAA